MDSGSVPTRTKAQTKTATAKLDGCVDEIIDIKDWTILNRLQQDRMVRGAIIDMLLMLEAWEIPLLLDCWGGMNA